MYEEFAEYYTTKVWELVIQLLILGGKHSIAFGGLTYINITPLLTYPISHILSDKPLTRPLFPCKINASVTYDGSGNLLTNWDRLHSLNIVNLQLIFERTLLKIEELTWIEEIHDFESLLLIYRPEHNKLLPASIAALKHVLSVGFNSIKEFILESDVFGSLDGFPWLQSFPNLETLLISSHKEISSGIIFQLTALESLTTLKLGIIW